MRTELGSDKLRTTQRVGATAAGGSPPQRKGVGMWAETRLQNYTSVGVLQEAHINKTRPLFQETLRPPDVIAHVSWQQLSDFK